MSQQPQCRVCGRWINFGPCACDECLTIIEKQRDDLALYAEQTQTAEARRALGEERILKQEALARATAAEAREAGLREALARIRAFARPIWSDARCGDEMRKIDADCLDDICDMVDVALAAMKQPGGKER